ncbi:MAG: pyruvate:ferredoxin (flavodoxin) oxidoreductase [Candidatus Wallbacteria bacterium]|nr:pyruvate:ferredoxin (flavodoxin) oxidoreductase [Candidatus Wallbacteria bacterium]
MGKDFKTIDGNHAASYIAYALSEVAAIYPITPSSTMGENADEWAAHGQKNIFGEIVDVIEMQSEGGAAGAVHGSLTAGALTTTFTASQGLMLMLPNMHKIAGELLPCVIHVSARSLACQALSIFGDHSDVMSARNTGFAMLASNSVQEAMDMALVAHLSTMESRIPFLHYFDGFRTSNEIQKVEMIDYDTIKSLVDMKYIEDFRNTALRPDKPRIKVGAQNPDVYFQGRETVNSFYDALPSVVKKYLKKVGEKTGRKYNLFDYYGAKDAEDLIVIMGSGAEIVQETIDYLSAQGQKVGAVIVRLYRPFSVKDFTDCIPATAKRIAVLDRTKEPGSLGEPLFLDVTAALFGRNLKIIGGRFGLSSKEFTPTMVNAVYQHLKKDGFHNFTVGINDDVTHRSVKITEEIDAEQKSVRRCKFWGLGSDGTVGANKNSIKIIGDHTDMYAQGYFQYDSKKSGGITISHLRFGKEKIRSSYYVTRPNFVALHNPAYIGRYDILEGIQENGTFLLNSTWTGEEAFNNLTREMQETIINKKIRFYNIDARKISEQQGLGGRINTVMQTSFFQISEILPEKEAISLIKKAVEKEFSKKGKDIVEMNWKCIDAAVSALEKVKIPATVKDIKKSAPNIKLLPDKPTDFMKKVIEPVMRLKGDAIPVSAMPIDGGVESGTAAIEKRGVSPYVPHWIPENCIQCNRCSFVCPHASIRTKLVKQADLAKAPKTFNVVETKPASKTGLKFRLQVYTEDCQGCESCVNVCPAPKKAIAMADVEKERTDGQLENAEFFGNLPDNTLEGTTRESLKGSQFCLPYMEFSGACGGCGETPYVKLVTQLYGERMMVANATGCSSIWGGTFPTMPYTKDKNGHGPSWANSLFEDNAEYGFGMKLAVNSNRKQLRTNLETLRQYEIPETTKTLIAKALDKWTVIDTESLENAAKFKTEVLKLKGKLNGDQAKTLAKVLELMDYITDKSVWIFGGDGWAYDIGYGGLDHVLAMGRNVNVLVMDTEVYSNTGGQSSKSTNLGAIAKFAASGKRTVKKNLGMMAMSYGYVYVASIAMGANPNQTVKALVEAESYPGPSIVIAYAPCIAHGIKAGLGKSQDEEKRAVDSGYWTLYRYNPLLALEGKNPFQLDSKEPTMSYQEFLEGEVRFSALKKTHPDDAKRLFAEAELAAKQRYAYYKKLAEMEQYKVDATKTETAKKEKTAEA